ncbi:MAG: hypothetical protein Fur0035_03580 [Anaerolineales bacterium]
MANALLDFFKSLFGIKPAPAPLAPSAPLNAPIEPAVIVTRRVLMLVFDPLVDTVSGQKLSQKMNWQRPEELAAGFLSDILEASGGLARYQIVQRIELNEFPLKADGFRYTMQSYAAAMTNPAAVHQPDAVDYQALLQRFDILNKVAANQIDEVWVFAFPLAGFYESVMGGLGAFWCNSNPLPNTAACPRRFIIMGFSYERKVGEMLESFGHRAESILERVYARVKPENNLWQKFIRYEKSHPGQAECGNVHFAPNSERDYDWGNPTPVQSRCDDWYNFPNFKGVVKTVSAADWGGGDMREHHRWWLKHFPKAAGHSNGIANNWWQYVMDVNRVS